MIASSLRATFLTGCVIRASSVKSARRKGVRVYLDHLRHGVKRALKAHVDLVL
jgi:hypothetical protein